MFVCLCVCASVLAYHRCSHACPHDLGQQAGHVHTRTKPTVHKTAFVAPVLLLEPRKVPARGVPCCPAPKPKLGVLSGYHCHFIHIDCSSERRACGMDFQPHGWKQGRVTSPTRHSTMLPELRTLVALFMDVSQWKKLASICNVRNNQIDSVRYAHNERIPQKTLQVSTEASAFKQSASTR